MAHFRIFELLIVLLLCQGKQLVTATSYGAAPRSCTSMDPSSGHYSFPQSEPSPYSVLVSRTNYSGGMEIYVTLKTSNPSEPFKGFLVKARRADLTENTSEIIGVFTPVDNCKTMCEVDTVANALTHDSPQQKLSLTFKWTAPTQPDADVVFRATFVQSYEKYWVDVRSPVVRLNKAHENLTTSTTSTPLSSVVSSSSSTVSTLTTSSRISPTSVTTSSASRLTPSSTLTTSSTSSVPILSSPTTLALAPSSSISTTAKSVTTKIVTVVAGDNNFASDTECAKTKYCYDDCGTSGCTFQVTLYLEGDNIFLTLKSIFEHGDKHWMAAGLSADAHMGNDSVSECVVVDGSVRAFQSYNKDYTNIRLRNIESNVELISGFVIDNIFECSIVCTKPQDKYAKGFDFENSWHVLFARGTANSDYSKQIHEFSSASSSAWNITKYNITPLLAEDAPNQNSVPAAVKGKFTKDTECGVTKGCFHDCDTDGCTFLVSWQPAGDEVYFGLKTETNNGPNMWMALAFSSDNKMGDDSVSECVSVGGTVKVFQSFNKDEKNNRLSDPHIGIRLDTWSRSDSVFQCSFYRNNSVLGDPKIFNISKSWKLMFGQGKADSNFIKQEHSVKPIVSADAVNMNETIEVFPEEDESLATAHGCLMVIAWIFSSSIGLIAARYYKTEWSQVNLFGLKIWLHIHRTCMVLAFLANCLGFILIFIHVEGYSDIEGEGFKKAHPVLGIIVTVLVIINPIMSIFRPGLLDSKRPIFNWAHRGVGTSAFVLGTITIFFGTQLHDTPLYLVYILGGYVTWLILTMLILESILCYTVKKYSVNKKMQIQMNSLAHTDEERPESVSPELLVKKIILGLHIAVVTIITITTIVVLILS